MPRYFFNVIDGQFLVDEEGTDCADMKGVRDEAIKTAGAILKDGGAGYASGLEWQMHVTNESKKTVLRLRFSVEEPA